MNGPLKPRPHGGPPARWWTLEGVPQKGLWDPSPCSLFVAPWFMRRPALLSSALCHVCCLTTDTNRQGSSAWISYIFQGFSLRQKAASHKACMLTGKESATVSYSETSPTQDGTTRSTQMPETALNGNKHQTTSRHWSSGNKDGDPWGMRERHREIDRMNMNEPYN